MEDSLAGQTITHQKLQLKAATEALQLSEEKYRIVVENANEAIIVSQDRILKFFNPKTIELTGYTAGELTSRSFSELVHPEDRKMVGERYQRRLQGQEVPSTYEFRIQRKDGSTRWVRINAALIPWENRPATLSLLTDITEHKLAEENLQQEELQFEILFDAISEGVALISPEGVVLKTNPAEKNMAGDQSSSYIGKHFKSPYVRHIYPDGRDLPEAEMAVSRALKTKRPVKNFEIGNVKQDGTVAWFNINAVPVLDKAGNVVYIVRTMTDITEQKRLRDEKARFTRMLIEVQEEERKRISRDLHDETAQYLALLTLEVDNLITKQASLSPEAIASLRKFKDTAEQALKEVRRYSHELRPSVLEHFGLREALELIINESNERSRTRTEFHVVGQEFRLAEEVELVLFRITQEALNNIHKHSQAAVAQVKLEFHPQKIRLTVSDNGRGFNIHQEIVPEGLGGLGIVGMKERASLIGADINIRSSIGKGTTVSVDLPLTAG